MTAAELTQLQYRLKQYLRNDDIERVLTELESLLLPSSDLFNDLTQLASRYANAKKEYYVKGTVQYKDGFSQASNQIREGLLLLIDVLIPEFLRSAEDFDPLFQELNQLPIDVEKALRPEYLVNCNRTETSTRYRSAKRQKLTNPLHFFLVQACPLQMPQSFVERAIWEEVFKLDNDPDAPFYYKENTPESILIPALPFVEQDIEESLQAFQIAFRNTHGQFFQRKFTHTAFGYSIHEKNWDDILPGFFDAAVEWLSQIAGASHRFFAFFLVVYIENLHVPDRLHPRQTHIREHLQAFTLRNSAIVSDISLKIASLPGPASDEAAEPVSGTTLEPVPVSEIEKWLHRIAQYGEAPNARRILDRFAEYVQKTARERYRDGISYDMRDVQELQKLVRRVALQQAKNKS